MPTNSVSEMAARTNREGWATVFQSWRRAGGGSVDRQVSPRLVAALDEAKAVGTKILGNAGRDGGHTDRLADVCALSLTVNASQITPCAESFPEVVWHLLVSHPALKRFATRWESLPGGAADGADASSNGSCRMGPRGLAQLCI